MTRMPSSGPGMAAMVRARHVTEAGGQRPLAPGHLGAVAHRPALADPIDEIAVHDESRRGLADDVRPDAELDRRVCQGHHRLARTERLQRALALAGVDPA